MDVLILTRLTTFKCVLGTVVDAYYRGYDVVLMTDGVATTSPEGGYENVVYNIGNVSQSFLPLVSVLTDNLPELRIQHGF